MHEIRLYNFDDKLKARIADLKVRTGLSQNNKQLILDFITWQDAKGVSKGRKYRQLYMLRRMAEMLGKDFDKVSLKDFQHLVAKVNDLSVKKQGKTFEASPWQKADFRITLKLFVKWLKGNDYRPQEFSWIKTRINSNEKQTRVEEGDVLSVEEIEALIRAAKATRDKALISAAYESAACPSELLTLRTGNVRFDRFGAVINIQQSKTKLRPIRLIQSATYLRSWLNIHPYRDDPGAPIWISSQSPAKMRIITIQMFRKMLITNARKSGMKKRIYPYLLRHSRLTHLVQKYPDQVVKRISGHVPTSRQFEVYLHMSNRDVDEAILKANGLFTDEDQARKELEQPVRCWNCGALNTIDNKYCDGCNFSLDFSNMAATMAELKKLSPIIQMLSRIQTLPEEKVLGLKRRGRLESLLRQDRAASASE